MLLTIRWKTLSIKFTNNFEQIITINRVIPSVFIGGSLESNTIGVAINGEKSCDTINVSFSQSNLIILISKPVPWVSISSTCLICTRQCPDLCFIFFIVCKIGNKSIKITVCLAFYQRLVNSWCQTWWNPKTKVRHNNVPVW